MLNTGSIIKGEAWSLEERVDTPSLHDFRSPEVL